MGLRLGVTPHTHAYLTDLNDAELRREVVEAKDELEQMTGGRVTHFSCPGGRWNARVAEVAREAGYQSVATSRIAANASNTNPFCLSRVAIMRGTNSDTFRKDHSCSPAMAVALARSGSGNGEASCG